MSGNIGGPSFILSPSTLPSNPTQPIVYGVVAGVDSVTSPTNAAVYINNNFPSVAGFSIPQGLGPFGPGGSSGFSYYYNNIKTNTGGSVVAVDLNSKTIVAFTGKVSTAPPTPVYTNTATRRHVGNLNPSAIPAIEPISVTSANSNIGAFPFYASSRQILTPVLTSGNVISTNFGSDLTLTSGLYQQTVATTTSTVGVTVPLGGWLFTDWVSENTGTGDWGPTIGDGTNYYQFLMSASTGNISLVKNGTILQDIILSVSESALHNLVFSIAYLGGTDWRLKCWVDGTEYIEFTDSFSALAHTLYPGFKCTANEVLHLEHDFYGYTDNGNLLELPLGTSAPSISGVSFAYPYVQNSSNFITEITFTGPVIQPWMEGLRITTTEGYVDIPGNASGNYSVVLELTGNRTVTAAYVDLTGNISPTTSLGTTSVPSATSGSTYTTAPNPTKGASQFSYVENTGSSTYDAIANIYLDSNGTTSNTALAGIELVSAPTGTTSYAVRGTVPLNGTGAYQPIWNDLSNTVQYDLGVRFIDTNGNKGNVYTIGTTALPPIFVLPLPFPDGIPVAPTVDGSSIVINPTVSQTDNVHQAGALQDFAVSMKVTNVPQDGSVDRTIWSYRRRTDPSAGNFTAFIENSAWLRAANNIATNAALVQWDSGGIYSPQIGDLVLMFVSNSGLFPNFTAGWTYVEVGNRVWVAYKIWESTDVVGIALFGNSQNSAYGIYDISNVDPANPITQFSLGPNGTGAANFTVPPVPSGTIIPTRLDQLPLFLLGRYNNGSGPITQAATFTNSFVSDGYAYDPNGISASPVSVFGGHGPLTADLITSINTTATLQTSYSAEVFWCGLFMVNSLGTAPPTIYPWTDYAYSKLSPLPIPSQSQSVSTSYGQLAVGVAYDLAISYVSVDNVVGPRLIYKNDYLSPITLTYPGTVSTSNAVVDSAFTKSFWGQNNAGPTGNANKAGINLNWKFFHIDGINDGFIAKGSDAQGNNWLGVPAISSGLEFYAISEPVSIKTAQKWMISGYIDATTCSGGSTGGAFIAVVDYTGINTFNTIYASKHQAAGQKGTISLNNAWTVPSGIDQVCFMFHSDQVSIASNNLVMALPMMENNTIATAYVEGPGDAADGSLRSPLVFTQRTILNTGSDATTMSTSPTQSGSTSAPISGGSAPAADQMPPGSTRQTNNPNIYIQQSSDPTNPNWNVVGTQDVAIVIYSQLFL